MATTLFPDLFADPVNDLSTEERNALVLRCERLCASLARGALGGVPGLDADDLTQEALLVFTEAAAKWSPRLGVKFSSYVTTGVRRHLDKLVITHRSRGEVSPESWDTVPGREEVGDEEQAAAEGYTATQAEAVARLTEPMRTAVRLVLDERLSPDRIAVQLNLSTKDVKLLLRNAAHQLRRDLASLGRPGLFELVGAEAEAA